ncbi:MAG: replication protein [Firmicutes bacterium]|nr:replication protein [Bacillota bacterium]
MSTRVRNYCLTLNNPAESDEQFSEYLQSLDHIKYFVFARERGDGTTQNPEGTVHLQGYVEFTNGKTFATLKKLFPRAHIEPRNGTKKAARDYVMKTGKYADKAHTRIGEVIEWGEFAEERARTDLAKITEMLDGGAAEREVREAFPTQYLIMKAKIREYIQSLREEKFKGSRRLDLEVTYICGTTGAGKTRYVLDTYGDENVFRMTRYGNQMNEEKFDGYAGEPIIIFEEFRSHISISNMLNYLDIYNVNLPARYGDKTACYTKAYIISNWTLDQQYKKIQAEHPETWKAFLRRIHYLWEYDRSPAPRPFTKSHIQTLCLQPINDTGLPF